MENNALVHSTLEELCSEFRANNKIESSNYEKFNVKRGLRNNDGTGVMAGLTLICNVHGFRVVDNERIPEHGVLSYRGMDVRELVEGCSNENRFGFEETTYLLLFGKLPTKPQLEAFCQVINECRDLPVYFTEDMIIKAPSPDIMNKMARSVLALYSYDDKPDDTSLENLMRQSIMLIAQLPTIMTYAYQVKRRHYEKKSMYFHPIIEGHSTAESILNALRSDRSFTDEEAKLLDICLVLHAEHGGGNNSSFATRVLTSSGTDTYSAIAAGIGSLKGPRHGGANIKVQEMMGYIQENVKDWHDEDEIKLCLKNIVNKEGGDGSGLIYGMGHAVYTLSDPRAIILKEKARGLAEKRGMLDRFELIERVEALAPAVFAEVKGDKKTISANVDMYSGLVYESLGITPDLYTPMFAISRIAGWCAHRIEEYTTGGRIIRPAYKSLAPAQKYSPLELR
ncbi:MAG: citrate/2-methylcitrate synthase [Oscillospiraceae bacterium]|jgi:citrate synthase|nr:citrate/2-methylcitrate synthase [Oscillospiraceae bacterium]